MIHNFLPGEGVHPQINSFLRLLVLCLVRPDFFVIHYFLFFQITHFFHWLPWQMPHQRFQRFNCKIVRALFCVDSWIHNLSFSCLSVLSRSNKTSFFQRVKYATLSRRHFNGMVNKGININSH